MYLCHLWKQFILTTNSSVSHTFPLGNDVLVGRAQVSEIVTACMQFNHSSAMPEIDRVSTLPQYTEQPGNSLI